MDVQTRRSRVSRIQDVTEQLGISKMTLRRWVEDGKFPRPIRLGPNSIAWLNDEIDAWLEERAAAREQ